MKYTLVDKPEAFSALVAQWRKKPRLWLDIEVADWFTTAPRLSLLQVWDGNGQISVVDVLGEPMRQILEERFVPDVMANSSVEKWAHYARFERRFLGQERVVNLKCTFEMARAIPYYRLPLRSLSLAALVKHFFGLLLDKTLQTADWGVRPLSPAHLEYAATDVEWCYRIHDQLQRIPSPPEPSEDDPKSIQTRYAEILCPLKEAKAVRSAIRDAVKEFMVSRDLIRFSRFVLQTRTAYFTSLAALVEFLRIRDPGGALDLSISLSAHLRSMLGPDVEARLRPLADIRILQSFRGPRTPRTYVVSPPPYVVRGTDVERLTHDYEAAEHNVLMLESERSELRDRMKRWMQLRGVATWGEFRFSKPSERWKVDVRILGSVIPDNTAVEIPFPRRLWLAFRDEDLESLIAAGDSQETRVLRWLPFALSVGFQAQESRDWEAVEDANDSASGVYDDGV